MEHKIKITFPDGSSKDFEKGITGEEIAKSISEGLLRKAICIKLDDDLLDLTRPLTKSADLKIITFADLEGKDVFRHSSAHLMAQAITRLYPEAKLTIGPVVDEGFYYDIDHPPFKQEDLEKIEEEMKKIVKEDLKIERKELTIQEALNMFKDNSYKQEIIKNIEEFGEGKTEKSDTVTIYSQGTFFDLCRGPHLPRTGMIKAFKLTKLAGAYWRGDSKNKQLQRIYGISFPEKKELEEYLKMMEDAEKRNHKKIGEDMELFAIFDLIGKGLPVWLPKGEIIRSEIEAFAIETEKKYGYVRVSTPNLAKKELFEKSGHLPHYEDSMYPSMKMDDGTYYLKAMNCPLHHLVFTHRPKSYKELPLRIAEYGTCYRNELSGALTGLLRVRILRMNDAHIYCTKEQIEQEIESTLTMIKFYYDTFGFEGYTFRLSLHGENNKEKYIDEPENWEYAEEVLRRILMKLKLPFVEAENEAAFYGPKIDIQFRNVYGREETMSTVQLDFAAKTRFNLCYADSEGGINNEVFVIHRAPLSTHERFTAFLIEHCGGKFPLWLSPVQVRILTIADRHNVYADKVCETLNDSGIRAEKDYRSETISKKVRNAQIDQVNYIVVIGDKEAESGTVNVRTRDNVVHGEKELDIFLNELLEEIKSKRRN
jgi:threonyl-tRNA synthetase